ncbi:hypothetical protein IP92_01499 [Pseudoduganella flava]|uniref:Uncharacterized protein n=1 Tax=Pseudoduganella flava TaxID=871742 RepID=A0A562Q1E5_9BURK|nr:hypothetical protein [Pseudoduganella flava]QGZ38203.1 hypothetical protein GO485_03490 [Pseudoduganella flava]TWI50270.1 hypothetical protein IP92_01499 [Pseudoduganella flava]
MQELISQLERLYLPADFVSSAASADLPRHLAGDVTHAFDLARGGAVRAAVIPFDSGSSGDGATQWERLCKVANALQGELGLPAPAVSVSGATGFKLWLSFAAPVDTATAQRFVDLLCAAYCPDVVPLPHGVLIPVELPPCRHPATGKWAAFIHPGMGASFADEPALEMPPPAAAQAAFLEGLQSIGAAQLREAIGVLERASAPPATVATPQGRPDAFPGDLLLRDATLEDIVRYLHAQNIEPTFRHVLPR